MRIKFGIRSFRTRIYPLNHFNVLKEEAEQFCVPYDGFDIWNFNKEEKVSEPRIERRFRYFHILFIPIIPLKIEWTVRKVDGLLYRANEKIEKKINQIYKNYSAIWFKRIVLLLILILFSYISYNLFLKNKIRSYRYKVKQIETLHENKVKELENLDEHDLILFVKKDNYLTLWDNSFREFGYVWKVENEKVHIKYLTGRLADIRSFNTIYFIQQRFKNNQKRLVDTVFTKSELIKRIPSKISQLKEAKTLLINMIIDSEYIDEPILSITNFSYDNFSLGNIGKPVFLIDIVNEKDQVCEWKNLLPVELKSKKTHLFDDFVLQAEIIDESKFNALKSKLIFTDTESNIFEFLLTRDKETNEFFIEPIGKEK